MKGTIKIRTDLCKGCTYCVETCPLGVISIGKRFNKNGFFPAVAVHLEKCTGCAMCARMCPEIAIEVFRDRGAGASRVARSKRRSSKQSA